MATEKFEVRETLTIERLRAVLDYDPTSGRFTWKMKRGNKAAGSSAGSSGHGYRVFSIDGRNYRAARLAYLLMTGEWPPALVDHIDGDRANDRWANLRAATTAQNAANSKKRSDQPVLKGVSFHRKAKRWSASIHVGGAKRHLGLFDTAEKAASAYAVAAQEFFGSFARAK